jgi:uncharacterized protein
MRRTTSAARGTANPVASRQSVVDRTEAYMRETLAGDASGHDPWHILRVRRAALHIGRREGADLYVVELAALLHDIADSKFHDGDEEIGPRRARDWLASLGVEPEVVEQVGTIVRDLSFKGAGVAKRELTLEGRVVQDADRLDAIGAIGVGRAFAYGGHKGRPLYDPAIPPEAHATAERYKTNQSPTLNHFHEKLLLLKDRLNTATARALAERRHRFLEEFVKRFLEEWEGRDLD